MTTSEENAVQGAKAASSTAAVAQAGTRDGDPGQLRLAIGVSVAAQATALVQAYGSVFAEVRSHVMTRGLDPATVLAGCDVLLVDNYGIGLDDDHVFYHLIAQQRLPYVICNSSQLPEDRAERNTWLNTLLRQLVQAYRAFVLLDDEAARRARDRQELIELFGVKMVDELQVDTHRPAPSAAKIPVAQTAAAVPPPVIAAAAVSAEAETDAGNAVEREEFSGRSELARFFDSLEADTRQPPVDRPSAPTIPEMTATGSAQPPGLSLHDEVDAAPRESLPARERETAAASPAPVVLEATAAAGSPSDLEEQLTPEDRILQAFADLVAPPPILPAADEDSPLTNVVAEADAEAEVAAEVEMAPAAERADTPPLPGPQHESVPAAAASVPPAAPAATPPAGSTRPLTLAERIARDREFWASRHRPEGSAKDDAASPELKPTIYVKLPRPAADADTVPPAAPAGSAGPGRQPAAAAGGSRNEQRAATPSHQPAAAVAPTERPGQRQVAEMLTEIHIESENRRVSAILDKLPMQHFSEIKTDNPFVTAAEFNFDYSNMEAYAQERNRIMQALREDEVEDASGRRPTTGKAPRGGAEKSWLNSIVPGSSSKKDKR